MPGNFIDAGEQALKNIVLPVRRASALLLLVADQRTPPSTQEELVGLNVDPGLRSRSKRSAQRCVPVAVYFSDGISEDIITDLSKLPELHVIARHSTFTYKGKAIDLKQVGRELGVRYVLEGSVRKAGNRVRVSSQLIDNRAGRAHPGDYRRAQSKIDAGTEQCPKRGVPSTRASVENDPSATPPGEFDTMRTKHLSPVS